VPYVGSGPLQAADASRGRAAGRLARGRARPVRGAP
jgi:hypothetical protein